MATNIYYIYCLLTATAKRQFCQIAGLTHVLHNCRCTCSLQIISSLARVAANLQAHLYVVYGANRLNTTKLGSGQIGGKKF